VVNTCIASAKLWVQTPVLPKREKKKFCRIWLNTVVEI
jgi:hypothetical protein